MRQSTLTSLAILKVNWDERGHDYADNFIPFVVEAIRISEKPEISVSLIQQTIKEHFGLVIPQGALNTLLRRIERRGLIGRQHGIFVRTIELANNEFHFERAEHERRQSQLLEKLISFAREQFAVTWDIQTAEAALIKHVQDSCIPILAAATDGCPIPPIKAVIPNASFIVNSFTLFLFERDSDGFALLEAVAKGNMLATALFLPEIANADKKFKGLKVYLDTRILLRALGLEGDGLRDSSRLLVIYGFILTLPETFSAPVKVMSYLAPICIVIFSALALWSLFTGGTVRELGRRLEARVSLWFEIRILSLFNVSK